MASGFRPTAPRCCSRRRAAPASIPTAQGAAIDALRSGVRSVARCGRRASRNQRAGLFQRADQREDARRSRSHRRGQHDRLHPAAAARVSKPRAAAARRAADRERRARRHRRARVAVRLGARHHARVRVHAARRRAGISDPAPEPSPRGRRRRARACAHSGRCSRPRSSRPRSRISRSSRRASAGSNSSRCSRSRACSSPVSRRAICLPHVLPSRLSRCGRQSPAIARCARVHRSRAAPGVAAVAARDRCAARALASAGSDVGERSRRADAGAGRSADPRCEAARRARRARRALSARARTRPMPDGVLALSETLEPRARCARREQARSMPRELPSRYLPSIETQRARQAKLPDRATLAAALARSEHATCRFAPISSRRFSTMSKPRARCRR